MEGKMVIIGLVQMVQLGLLGLVVLSAFILLTKS